MTVELARTRPHLRLVTVDDAPAEVLDEWQRWMESQGLSQRTIVERLRIVRQVGVETGTLVTELMPPDLQMWLAQVKTASTRESYYSALVAWSKWLVVVGHRIDDPTMRVPRPRVPRRQPRPVSTKHIETLLASTLEASTRTKILLAAYAGLRVHEIAKVRGHDVDLVDKTIRIIGKGGTDEILPLHDVLAGEAAILPRRGLWFPSPTRLGEPVRSASVSNVISDAFARIGVDATAHQIRHWFATTLLASGVDVRVVRELMRHKSLNTTAGYTLVPDARRRAALRRLPCLRLPYD